MRNEFYSDSNLKFKIAQCLIQNKRFLEKSARTIADLPLVTETINRHRLCSENCSLIN